MRKYQSLFLAMIVILFGFTGCSGISSSDDVQSDIVGIGNLQANLDEVADDDISEPTDVTDDDTTDDTSDETTDDETSKDEDQDTSDDDAPTLKIAITPKKLPNAALGKAYNVTVLAKTTPKRLTGAFEWSVDTSLLPQGLEIKDVHGKTCTDVCVGGSIKITGTPDANQKILADGYAIGATVKDPKSGVEASQTLILKLSPKQYDVTTIETDAITGYQGSNNTPSKDAEKGLAVSINKHKWKTNQKVNIQEIVDAGEELNFSAKLANTNTAGLEWQVLLTTDDRWMNQDGIEIGRKFEVLMLCPDLNICSFSLGSLIPAPKSYEERSRNPKAQVTLFVFDAQKKEVAKWSATLTYEYPEDPLEGIEVCMAVKDVDSPVNGGVAFYVSMDTKDGDSEKTIDFYLFANNGEGAANVRSPKPESLVGDLSVEHAFIGDNTPLTVRGQTVVDDTDFDVLWMYILTKHWVAVYCDDCTGDLINDEVSNAMRSLDYGFSRNTESGNLWVRRRMAYTDACQI